MTTVVFWTPHKEKILKEMWLAGHFARDIGKAVGATKNAVIGKARRLKLPVSEKRPTLQYTPKPKKKPVQQEASLQSMLETEKSYSAVRDAVMELGKGECRWPFGAPHEGMMTFCRAPVYETYSYCLGHCEVAYSNFEEARKERAQLNKRRKTT
jgi:GcrA cell cycle regulator